jgi:hypothetical protein
MPSIETTAFVIRQRRDFAIAVAGTSAFVILTAVAMLLYPGGTPDDPTRPGYSFFINVLSDLGRSRAFNGRANFPSRVLFATGMFLGAIALVSFFRAFAATTASYRQGQKRAAARLSHAGSIIGIAAAGCFVGIACTPWDLYISAHMGFVLWAFRLFLIAIVLNLLAVFAEPSLPRRAAWVFAVFAIMLMAYMVVLVAGMHGTGPTASAVFQATGQKVIAYASILTVMFQSIHMRQHLSGSGQ